MCAVLSVGVCVSKCVLVPYARDEQPEVQTFGQRTALHSPLSFKPGHKTTTSTVGAALGIINTEPVQGGLSF